MNFKLMASNSKLSYVQMMKPLIVRTVFLPTVKSEKEWSILFSLNHHSL